jgi:hypothetical protein
MDNLQTALKTDPLAELKSLKRTIKRFVDSENEVVIQHRALPGVTEAEMVASGRLEAFQTMLFLMPKEI